MTTQRGSLGVAAGPGGIFAVGGFDSKRSLDSFEVLDPAMNIWRLNPSCMNAQRVAVSAVGVEDEVRDSLYVCVHTCAMILSHCHNSQAKLAPWSG